jgi:gluconate kinase
MIGVRQHYWRQGAQPLNDDFRFVQLAQVRVACSEKLVRRDKILVLCSDSNNTVRTQSRRRAEK